MAPFDWSVKILKRSGELVGICFEFLREDFLVEFFSI
jgi:hypothetical protein